MPAISTSNELSAIVGFTLPADRLDHDASKYLKYEPGVQRPFERIRVPMADFRPRLESTEPLEQQLASQGFAITRQKSELLDSIPSEEGTAKYLQECCE